MKLYLSPTSPYGRICLVRAMLKQLDSLQLQFVNPWDNPPELEAVHPLNQIPVLVTDDGTPIANTLLICQYLGGGAPDKAELQMSSYASTLLDTCIQIVKLVRFKTPETPDHPLVARSHAALARALAKAPALDGNSDAWPQVMLALVLQTVQRLCPKDYEAAARPDTRAAVDAFAARPLARKTTPEALSAHPASVAAL